MNQMIQGRIWGRLASVPLFGGAAQKVSAAESRSQDTGIPPVPPEPPWKACLHPRKGRARPNWHWEWGY